MPSQSVAFQGEPGAYSELAALEYLGESITAIPCATFEEVYAAVKTGTCERAMLPFENSLAGSIHRNYDLIQRHELHIVSEYYFRVNHCLLGIPGAQLTDIQQVHSHPQALAQCEQNLDKLGLERIAEADTAGSARLVKSWADPSRAAIASRHAAEVNGLDILVDTLEDNLTNYTRFLVLAPEPLDVPDLQEGTGSYKTSIVFSLKNVPGALFKAISVFALREIDLTKIESRPIPNQPWAYMFYIDFVGHQQEQNCARALDHLGELAAEFRMLGSYPRFPIPNI